MSALIVEPEHDGERLDRYLAQKRPDLSRSLIQKHIERGAVSIGGSAPKRGSATLLKSGDRIEYDPPPPVEVSLLPERIGLSIVYQDDDLVVIDKQRGLVVHPALGHWSGTLVNALLAEVPGFRGIGGELRPGIVHRLDRDTTGVMVVAKHDAAQRALAEQFKARTVDKEYLAIVWGHPSPPEATIDAKIGRHPTERKRFSSKVTQGKRAVTHYRVEEILGRAARVRVQLETGRTHQIRVHLADRGHPLVGDRTYGPRRPLVAGFDRPALHARRLAFDHPTSGQRITFEAEVPQDLLDLIAALRE